MSLTTATFLYSFLLLASSAVVGRAIAGWLPFTLRAPARFYLSPVLGAAFYLLLCIPYGWLVGYGGGMGTRLLHGAAVVLGLWWDRDRRSLLRYLVFLFGFSLIAGAPMLLQVVRFEAFLPYNDAYTYLCHAQWLQEHPFRETAAVSFQPAWTQVLSYQDIHMRMGASFFLGWVQSITGAPWSYQVYPAVMILAMTAGALALAGGIAAAVRWKRWAVLTAGLCLPAALNGFNFSINHGFLPQTYGLLFALGGFVLFGSMLRRASRSGARSTPRLVVTAGVIGLLLAAAIHAYIEFSPFLAAACGLAGFIALLLHPRSWSLLARLAGVTALSTLFLVNLEWVRLYKALLVQSKGGAAIGKPVPWPISEFLLHSIGWRGPFFEASASYPGQAIVGAVASCILVAILAALFFWALRTRRRSLTLLPSFAMLAMLGLAFFYFRFRVASPWPTGVGQTWNQHKLSDWASPFLLLVACVAGPVMIPGKVWGRRLVGLFLLGFLAVSLARNHIKTPGRTATLRLHTGMAKSPYLGFEQLRALVAQTVPRGATIYLDLPDAVNTQRAEARRMVAYFLHDYRVLSHWRDDLFIYGLPNDEVVASVQRADWIISSRPWPNVEAQTCLTWFLFPRPADFIYLGYTQDPLANWNQFSHSINFWGEVGSATATKIPFKLRGRVTTPDLAAPIAFHVEGRNLDASPSLHQNPTGEFEVGPFEAEAGDLKVAFTLNRPAGDQAGEFLIYTFRMQDLELIRLDQPGGVFKVQ